MNSHYSFLRLYYLYEGYSALDIIGTIFRIVKNFDMKEALKLELIKVMLSVKVVLSGKFSEYFVTIHRRRKQNVSMYCFASS